MGVQRNQIFIPCMYFNMAILLSVETLSINLQKCAAQLRKTKKWSGGRSGRANGKK